MTMHFCRRCNQEKSVSEFGLQNGRPKSWCKLCQREYGRAHYRKNEEVYKDRARSYREANPERKRAIDKQWRLSNKDRCRANTRAWIERNPEKRREIWRKWYAANRAQADAASKQWIIEHPEEVKSRARLLKAARKNAAVAWGNKRAICLLYREASLISETTGILHEVDHIIPLVSKVVCGLHWEANLRIVPQSVNRAKGNRVSHDV